MNWDRRHLEGNVTARDIVETAAAYVPEMKEAGAEIIIALSHSGIGADAHTEGMENASVPLAAIDGIDAIMTGHHHLEFPGSRYEATAAVDPEKGTLHGKPAVMGGFWGSHLGLIDLMLERSGNTWRIAGSESSTRPISKRNEDRSITPLVESQAASLRLFRRNMTRPCPTSGAPSARPTPRSTATLRLSLMTPRSRSSRSRRNGTSAR